MKLLNQAVVFALAAVATLAMAGQAFAQQRLYDPVKREWVTINPIHSAATRNVSLGGSTGPVAREMVAYDCSVAVGTIIVETSERRTYLVTDKCKAMKYAVGVGRPGFTFQGTYNITRKVEWPGWTPPAAMRKRQPDLPAFMPGGPENPLGSRALYVGSTLYRLHGTPEAWSIGGAVSSGCIRFTQDDIQDLYKRVPVGARVIVRL
ncbi:MAG: L,D-transpeptidase [Alphaproteobacteria bacterium]|nr:L,D-transpeptidase [Alphaproteobacteria bacterium]